MIYTVSIFSILITSFIYLKIQNQLLITLALKKEGAVMENIKKFISKNTATIFLVLVGIYLVYGAFKLIVLSNLDEPPSKYIKLLDDSFTYISTLVTLLGFYVVLEGRKENYKKV